MKYEGGLGVLRLPGNRAQDPIGAKLAGLDGIGTDSIPVDPERNMARLRCGGKKLENLWSTTAIG